MVEPRENFRQGSARARAADSPIFMSRTPGGGVRGGEFGDGARTLTKPARSGPFIPRRPAIWAAGRVVGTAAVVLPVAPVRPTKPAAKRPVPSQLGSRFTVHGSRLTHPGGT